MLVRKKRNLEKDLIIIKVLTGPIEKNIKYHSSVSMNIMGNTVVEIGDCQFTLVEQCEVHKQLKEREMFR